MQQPRGSGSLIVTNVRPRRRARPRPRPRLRLRCLLLGSSSQVCDQQIGQPHLVSSTLLVAPRRPRRSPPEAGARASPHACTAQVIGYDADFKMAHGLQREKSSFLQGSICFRTPLIGLVRSGHFTPPPPPPPYGEGRKTFYIENQVK
jgi:hypothetical protein